MLKVKKIIGQQDFTKKKMHFRYSVGKTWPCADPGIFVRGVQVSLTKKALTTLFFFGPQLILRKSNGRFIQNISFFKVPEGSNIFQGGGGSNFFQGRGGSNCLFLKKPI